MLKMSHGHTAQETLEIMKESEKRLVEESVNRSKAVSRSPSKEEPESDEPNARQEPQRRNPSHGHARKRAKSNSKLKLVRSLAVCEESSGPFVDGCLEPQDVIHLHISCPSDKEEKCCKDGPEKDEKNKEKGPKKMLSRDSSQEYTDSTGIDVHEFLVNTLKNNPRDRMMLLKLEQEILEFINDNSNQFKKFPQMTSYHRMLLHRAAAYFGMDHNVDQTGKAVIINKTSNTRIPEQRFSEHIKDEKSCEFQQRFILKRDDASMDRDDNQIRVPLQDGRRSKSIEEREEEYQRVRERIFARESAQNGHIADNRVYREGFSTLSHKRRQLFRGNRDFLNRGPGSRQSSTESELKSLDPRPWSSTDSDGSCRNMRPPVTKASSFSGISILTRGDSIGSNKNAVNRTGRPGLPISTPEVCSQATSSQQSTRSIISCTAQQQHPHPHQALPPTPQQQSMSNHLMSQADDLNSHFGQMTLSRQGSSEVPDPSAAIYQSSLISQHPQQAGFIMTSGGQAIPPTGYPSSGHPSPTQQVMPPQGFMQPPQQIQVSYYPTGQYPNSSQQYRPLPHTAAYNSQRNQQVTQPPQQPGMQPIISNQPPAYQGMMGVQQSQNPAMLNNQRASVGNQMQSMMVQYTPLPSYQVPVGNESQGVVSQTYQQPVLVPTNQTVQGTMQAGGMPVYYSVIPPAQQNGSSTSVGYLPPHGSEQYQMPQSPSPCSPQQMQQQYSGVNPSSLGVVVMQLNVPNGPQATSQNPPVVQWNHCKYFSVDQRGQKPEHLYAADASTQASNLMNSPITSPAQSPAPSPGSNMNSVCTGLSQLSVIPQFPRPVGPAQGDARYSLLGQPLQYNLSVCPPMLHSQPPYSAQLTGMKHGNRGKRQALKSASTDLGSADIVLGRVLEITDLPEGITRAEAGKLFTQLAMSGAKIQWLRDAQGHAPGPSGNNNGPAENGRQIHNNDLAAFYTIVAVFPSTMAAQNASVQQNSPLSHFKLRSIKKNYDLRILERASSQ
ncbi:PREDICTED: R3H domain-containing protein 2 isoform X3 [Nanorana parkeri]|uniref:R3H domain-containing protein 2 isoform X3 n=1 Tax=Nanorana parkeri TaxID=125878 RepID=UPI000854A007|nr:PREDICTED: R3H domain-containing protein 2 isoform X3 [Nanorana parkeri]